MFLRVGGILAVALMFGQVPVVSGFGIPGNTTKSPARTIDINKASVKDFEMLPGFGSYLAQQVVTFREKHGPFHRVEDLMVIKGIGFKKWKQIRPYIRIGQGKEPPGSGEIERVQSHPRS